jgi:deazaflavin-dependent oxidoreductase (nitroreductase family)
MAVFGRLTAATSEFANRRGIYLGRRSTRIHVALYRWSSGKLGGHVPAWFHNLKASPDTTIQVGSVVREVRARIATEDERDRLWPQFVAFYPGYDFFQRNAKGRRIPIVIFDPR